jgi:hypothetical protein
MRDLGIKILDLPPTRNPESRNKHHAVKTKSRTAKSRRQLNAGLLQKSNVNLDLVPSRKKGPETIKINK